MYKFGTSLSPKSFGVKIKDTFWLERIPSGLFFLSVCLTSCGALDSLENANIFKHKINHYDEQLT